MQRVCCNRRTALRDLTQCSLQGKLLAFFLGNGPAGHVWQEDKAVFYHRAQLIKGSLLLRSGSAQGSDFGWFSKPEVLEQTQQPELRHVLDGMLW